jgi:hypothetical protein
MVALQVRDHMKEGRGAPTEEDMKRFIEEALAVCQMEYSVDPEKIYMDSTDQEFLKG